jgi:hypothetical protein
MPLKRCTKDGQQGWKWGDQGVCYIGPGAREKALKQGRAIEAQQRKDGAKDGGPSLTTEVFVRG